MQALCILSTVQRPHIGPPMVEAALITLSTSHAHFSKLKCPPLVDTPISRIAVKGRPLHHAKVLKCDIHGCVDKKNILFFLKKHLTNKSTCAIIKVQRGAVRMVDSPRTRVQQQGTKSHLLQKLRYPICAKKHLTNQSACVIIKTQRKERKIKI